ncbi:unnamed protein product [Adineta steineri]|uniref:Uncharacterized protein n=1 Tax=Adineta steineri TaxID=433720 RepID=A0A815UVS8_9BILA|nr:unnamed protein product [Adineta steineri]CAF1651311.1 unnamed protein product [Adineta steineri]
MMSHLSKKKRAQLTQYLDEQDRSRTPMAAILRSYNKFVLKNPLLVMSLTTGTTMGLGNIISQTIIGKRT